MGWQSAVEKEIEKRMKGGKPQTVMLNIQAPFERKVMERMNYAISLMESKGYVYVETAGKYRLNTNMMLTFKLE